MSDAPPPSLQKVLSDLADAPEEAVTVALAYALYQLEGADSERQRHCFEAAEYYLGRLRDSGFDVVKVGHSLHAI
jgi:hypothetical protein